MLHSHTLAIAHLFLVLALPLPLRGSAAQWSVARSGGRHICRGEWGGGHPRGGNEPTEKIVEDEAAGGGGGDGGGGDERHALVRAGDEGGRHALGGCHALGGEGHNEPPEKIGDAEELHALVRAGDVGAITSMRTMMPTPKWERALFSRDTQQHTPLSLAMHLGDSASTPLSGLLKSTSFNRH